MKNVKFQLTNDPVATARGSDTGVRYEHSTNETERAAGTDSSYRISCRCFFRRGRFDVCFERRARSPRRESHRRHRIKRIVAEWRIGSSSETRSSDRRTARRAADVRDTGRELSRERSESLLLLQDGNVFAN